MDVISFSKGNVVPGIVVRIGFLREFITSGPRFLQTDRILKVGNCVC